MERVISLKVLYFGGMVIRLVEPVVPLIRLGLFQTCNLALAGACIGAKLVN